MPPIITRAQWGADESKRNRGPIYPTRSVGFVHHTVSSSTYSESQAAAQMRNLYAWYTEGLKYSDMAHNFLVDRFGPAAPEGRGGGMSRPVVGGHRGLNNDSFAVSAMGNFDEFNPADPQMSAIKESIAELMAWKLGLTQARSWWQGHVAEHRVAEFQLLGEGPDRDPQPSLGSQRCGEHCLSGQVPVCAGAIHPGAGCADLPATVVKTHLPGGDT